jgi:hypothetical protein
MTPLWSSSRALTPSMSGAGHRVRSMRLLGGLILERAHVTSGLCRSHIVTRTVSVNLRHTTRDLLRSVYVGTTAGLVVQRLAMEAKARSRRGPVIRLHSRVVLHNRLQGLARPHERCRVETTRPVVTALSTRWGVRLVPVVGVPVDHHSPARARSVATPVLARQLPCGGGPL